MHKYFVTKPLGFNQHICKDSENFPDDLKRKFPKAFNH